MQREYLGIVKDSAESLLALINDILDFSKVEAGRLELDRDLPGAGGARRHDEGAGAARLRQGTSKWPAMCIPMSRRSLEGDALRLRQVVSNLVGNAIKFTQKGEVVLDVAEESSSDEQDVPALHVRDTGIGIPSEKQQAIFDAFSQADASTTRRFGGTGLGLAIASRLVSLMRGRLWVESEVGRGSRFHFTASFTSTE